LAHPVLIGEIVCRTARTQQYSDGQDDQMILIPVPAAAATSLRNLLWILSETSKGS
jgi:hypothetical protein